MAAFAAICSCTSSSDDLLSRVPADTEVVVVGDVKTVFESAGGTVTDSKVKMPEWLMEITDGEIDKNLDEVNDFIKNSGVNLDACMLAMNYDWESPLVVVKLDDRKKFVKYIEDNEFSEYDENQGINFYKQGGSSYIALKDSYAYSLTAYDSGRFEPVKGITRIIDEAKQSPFSKTSMAKYMDGNVLGVSFMIPRRFRQELRAAGLPSTLADLYDGYFCLKGSLDDDDVKIEAKIFDSDGNAKSLKDFGKMMNLNARVSSKALAFMGKNESLVFASSLKDVRWSDYLDMIAEATRMSSGERRQLGIVEDYLNNIDGTLACGFGFTNGLQSVFALDAPYGGNSGILNQIAFTLVVETKDGKAKKVLGDVEDLMNMASIPYEGTASKGFVIASPLDDSNIYLSVEDNFLVLSNHKIQKSKDNSTVKAFDFDDYLAALACYLDKDNKLMKDLGLKNDVLFSYYGDVKDMELTMKIEVKGGKGAGVLEKIGNMILTASKTDFTPYYPSFGDSYSYYD